MTATGASKAQRIVAYIRDEGEADTTARIVRETVRTSGEGGGEGTLRLLAATPGPLVAALPTGIIWDLHAASLPSLTAIVREAISADRMVPPILVRVELAEVRARQLITLGRLIPRLRLSTRGLDELKDDVIDWLLTSDQPTAEQAIIARLATSPLTPRISLAIQAAVAAKRRIHLRAFANAIDVPLRTIEGRLRAEGSLEAWCLIGMSISLHALWRLEVRRWSLKRVATSLGFGSVHTLGSHLQRHLGARPRALLARYDFEFVLDAYHGRLASRLDGGMST